MMLRLQLNSMNAELVVQMLMTRMVDGETRIMTIIIQTRHSVKTHLRIRRRLDIQIQIKQQTHLEMQMRAQIH